MALSDLLKQQAQRALAEYKTFEQLKNAYMRENHITDESDTPMSDHEAMAAEGYNDSKEMNEWASYMEKFAHGEFLEEHSEAFPASKPLDPQEYLEASDEKLANGIEMGLPIAVWVHTPYAGRVLPSLGDESGE